VLTKQEILARGHAAFFADYRVIERGLQNREYEYEHTSGSYRSQPIDGDHGGRLVGEQTRRSLSGASATGALIAGQPVRKAVLAPVACSSNLFVPI